MKIIRNRRGSYIAEAALTLPVFILCVTALALIIRIIAVCENIGFVTALEARDISLSSVSLCTEKNIEKRVCEENPQLTDFRITNLDYLYSDGNIDDLIGINSRSIFTVENPIGIYGQIEFTEGLLLRGFTGAERREEPLSEEDFTDYEKSQPVVVFPRYGIRYHVKTCRYVRQEYDGQEYRMEMELEDAKLKGYTACMICGGGENE
ncbi:MAG: hypothetical protein ACI4LP_06350 [Anaerovoracaceae bacterium]